MTAHGGWRLPGQAVVRRDQALLHPLLLLHPAVLEPDLDLGLVELQSSGDLDPTSPGQVLVEVELLLQLRQLLRREVGPPGVVDPACVVTSRVAVGVGFRNWNKINTMSWENQVN